MEGASGRAQTPASTVLLPHLDGEGVCSIRTSGLTGYVWTKPVRDPAAPPAGNAGKAKNLSASVFLPPCPVRCSLNNKKTLLTKPRGRSGRERDVVGETRAQSRTFFTLRGNINPGRLQHSRSRNHQAKGERVLELGASGGLAGAKSSGKSDTECLLGKCHCGLACANGVRIEMF